MGTQLGQRFARWRDSCPRLSGRRSVRPVTGDAQKSRTPVMVQLVREERVQRGERVLGILLGEEVPAGKRASRGASSPYPPDAKRSAHVHGQ